MRDEVVLPVSEGKTFMQMQVAAFANGLRRSAKRLGRGQRQRPLRPSDAGDAEELRENDVALAWS